MIVSLAALLTVSGSGISWAICKSAPRSRQITTLAAHQSVFYKPDALPAAQPTVQNKFSHLLTKLPSVLWRCWLGGRKGIRPVKNRLVGCWRGYLSGVRCRLAYGLADATATHCLLIGFTVLVLAHMGIPGHRAVNRVCVCVCVCVTQVPGDWWNIGYGACWCRCVCIDDVLLRLFPGVARPRSSHHRVQFASVAVRSQTTQLQRRLRSTRTTQRSASCFTSHSQRTNVFFLSFV